MNIKGTQLYTQDMAPVTTDQSGLATDPNHLREMVTELLSINETMLELLYEAGLLPDALYHATKDESCVMHGYVCRCKDRQTDKVPVINFDTQLVQRSLLMPPTPEIPDHLKNLGNF